MASLLNRSGTYYATFTDNARTPRQKRHSLRTKSKRTAERILDRLSDAYAEGTWDPWTGMPADVLHEKRIAAPRRLGEAVALYLSYAEGTLRPSTIRTRRRIVERFAESVGPNEFVQRVTARDVETFIRSGDPAASTQKTRLIGVKALFTFLRREGHVTSSPAHEVPNPKPPPRLPRAVTDEELAAVLDAIPDGRAWTKPVFEFAALTGLRVGELAMLRWDSVDIDRRLIRIEHQKNGKAETQPMPKAALDVISTLPRQGPYVFTSPRAWGASRNVATFCWSLDTAFREARKAAGIQRAITPHGLRHRYCTKLAEAGASAFTIAAAARHGGVKTSQVYVSISNLALQTELDKVFAPPRS